MKKSLRSLHTEVESGTNVDVLDKPGQGGACHEYRVRKAEYDPKGNNTLTRISFQNGPIKENGINGCQQEDLLMVVIDRLEHFQNGPFACESNALALTYAQSSLAALNGRTADRLERGVEGKNVK